MWLRDWTLTNKSVSQSHPTTATHEVSALVCKGGNQEKGGAGEDLDGLYVDVQYKCVCVCWGIYGLVGDMEKVTLEEKVSGSWLWDTHKACKNADMSKAKHQSGVVDSKQLCSSQMNDSLIP